MAYIDFLSDVHKKTTRDYVGRVNGYPKWEAAEKAKQWGYDYWDGDRRICYGGYHYDGRWKKVAERLRDHYQLKAGDKVLDVGCGKGFLVHDLCELGIDACGMDVSSYAIEHAKEEVRSKVQLGHAKELPFADKEFELVISINTLHNLYNYELSAALQEMERVAKRKYLCVESYRDEKEKQNLLYWQVTCEAFCTPLEWEWWFQQTRYTGDYSFIYFE